MVSQEEANEFLLKVSFTNLPFPRGRTNNGQAWEAVWLPDQSTLSEYYAKDAVVSGFHPPKQTTWTGIDAIGAVRDSMQHSLFTSRNTDALPSP
jgi:hypothetical protein